MPETLPSSEDVEKGRIPAKAAASSQEIGWASDWNIAQYAGELVPGIGEWQMLRELEIMALTDETMGAVGWAIAAMCAQVIWKHEPQVDGETALNDPEAIKMASFADSLMLDMVHSWSDHVDDALNMVWGGFSLCEMVTKQRKIQTSRFSDGYYGFERLSLRSSLTLNQWQYDATRRNVVAVQQNAYAGSAVIPMWKMLHYRTTGGPEKPMGRSLYRPAHRAWRLKQRIQDTEAIGIERELVGLPIFRIPESDLEMAATLNNADGSVPPQALAARARIQNAISAVSNMRFNKSGGLVLPSDTFAEDIEGDRTPKYDFKIVTSGGSRAIDARTVARDYDVAMARVVLMQFLHLGTRSSGSYGLSDDQSTMAVSSLTALVFRIAYEWNLKGLRNLIWPINGFDAKYLPSLMPQPLTKDGIQAVGALFTGLAKATDLYAGDVVARTSLLRLAGVSYDPVAQAQAADTAQKAATEAAKPKPTPIVGAGPSNQAPAPAADPEE